MQTQVWDLRNAVSPHTELAAHGKGVLSMAWCESDSSLLLSCAKDNRTYCWDTNSGEVVAEVPASTNWNFDVQWSPRCPGVLSTASFDGKLSLHNLQVGQRGGWGEMASRSAERMIHRTRERTKQRKGVGAMRKP
jgi:protein transport protein SEC31